MDGIIRFLLGGFRFELCGDERILCAALNRLRDIRLYDIKRSNDTVAFSCFCRSAESVTERIKDLDCTCVFAEKGILRPIFALCRHFGILIGILLCAAIHLFCTSQVWDIRIYGNERLSESEILRTLEEIGLYKGCSLSDMKADELYLSYLSREERVAWMHVNLWGVVANIEISERKQKPSDSPDKKEICNIVAKCDGIILRSDVYSGGKEAFEGESVTKGQLLVSSFFETRMSGYLLRRAKGTVWARTEPTVEMHIPKEFFAAKTEKISEKAYLSLLRRKIPLYGQNRIVSTSDNALCRRECDEMTFEPFSVITLPFTLKKEKYKHIYLEKAQRSKTAARSLYAERLTERKKLLSRRAEILFEQTEERETDDEYIFTTRFICRENIGIERTVGADEKKNDGEK